MSILERRSRLTRYLEYQRLLQRYEELGMVAPDNPYLLCTCFTGQDVGVRTKETVKPRGVQNRRVSRILQSSLGGKVTYGIFGELVPLTFLGGIEGQPGGIPFPPRNQF